MINSILYLWMLNWTLPNSFWKWAGEIGIQELLKKLKYIWKKWPFCQFGQQYGLPWTPYKQSIRYAKFSRRKRANGVPLKIRDVSVSWLVECYFAYSWWLLRIWGARSSFEMLAVEVRCQLFPYTRDANSYFEERMASTFGEEKSVDTQFCQRLVSISLHSTF